MDRTTDLGQGFPSQGGGITGQTGALGDSSPPSPLPPQPPPPMWMPAAAGHRAGCSTPRKCLELFLPSDGPALREGGDVLVVEWTVCKGWQSGVFCPSPPPTPPLQGLP
mmetsp:Transcript_47385/g.84776  ORF Transcript_47385/g.84776 Transcript_47385/m.84776 type:complete len:109 (+) Transcript_47385:455-781(+)